MKHDFVSIILDLIPKISLGKMALGIVNDSRLREQKEKMANKKLNLMADIFIGIVSLVGIDTKPIKGELEKHFERLGYEYIPIKISDEFLRIAKDTKSKILDNFQPKERIERYIEFGNEMRKKCSNDFWAKCAVDKIIEHNGSTKADPSKKGKAYILDQIKTENELNLFKSIYGKAFFQLSIYSARDKRVDYLAKYKAKKDNKRDSLPYRAEAETLVNTDYKEDNPNGQKVSKIFELADFIVNADNEEEHPIEQQISRFVELLFGSNKYSPYPMEYGMYLAHSAALRSLDLSRQVGAAIFRCTGEIATLGCNEVPKAKGGTYWSNENHCTEYDAREWRKGSDSNDMRKNELLKELKAILLAKLTEKQKETLTEIIKDKTNSLEDSQFMDALEYGRIVHAEMNAITDASRLGIPLQDATLYCTTFPCHMCSKLIIASGLKNVIFLEPYPKSLTSDMHPDAVKIEGTSREGYEKYPYVEFNHFYGITASRYAEFFRRKKRKDGVSKFLEYHEDGEAKPIFAPYEIDHEAEAKAAEKFIDERASVSETAEDVKMKDTD